MRAGNSALDSGDTEAARHAARQVLAMTSVLGVNPYDAVWQGAATADSGLEHALDALVQERLAARAAARKDRDFATADAIRDSLTAAGVAVEDTPAGARWSLARHADDHKD